MASYQIGPAADVGELGNNTGGASDGTLQAVPDPADLPATADALRDDLVANALPAIRNNYTDLVDKLNDLRTKLRAAGLMV